MSLALAATDIRFAFLLASRLSINLSSSLFLLALCFLTIWMTVWRNAGMQSSANFLQLSQPLHHLPLYFFEMLFQPVMDIVHKSVIAFQ